MGSNSHLYIISSLKRISSDIKLLSYAAKEVGKSELAKNKLYLF